MSDTNCVWERVGAIVVSKDKIVAIGKRKNILKNHQGKIIDYNEMTFLPGFYDNHFHWVQDKVRLAPKDKLLDWLEKYAWPYEYKFRNKEYSKKQAVKFSKELSKAGTIGGAIYASVHTHTVSDAIRNFQGDFIVGNVLMDMNSTKKLEHTYEEGIRSIKLLSNKFKEKYALTPRFAITTSPKLMKEGKTIVKPNKGFIQTHLSETPDEIKYVLSIYKKIKGFEKVKSYTEIYHKCGLLGRKTIMGHGIYLSQKELEVLSKTKTAIAHCPTSNAPISQNGLGAGLFDFKKIEKANIRWSLASDIGGGPFLSMFDVMRSFVDQNKRKKGATYSKALFRSTVAGAEILGLKNKSGNFKVNKFANFNVVLTPKLKENENAESILSDLIVPLKKDRSKYDSLLKKTFYHGKIISK